MSSASKRNSLCKTAGAPAAAATAAAATGDSGGGKSPTRSAAAPRPRSRRRCRGLKIERSAPAVAHQWRTLHPFNVAQEVVAEPAVFVRAVDEARQVRHRDLTAAGGWRGPKGRGFGGQGLVRHWLPAEGAPGAGPADLPHALSWAAAAAAAAWGHTRRRSLYSSTPMPGRVVVKGNGATWGRALLAVARNEDLPAFGNPTRPTC